MKVRSGYFAEHHAILTDYAIYLLYALSDKLGKINKEPLFRAVFEALGFYAKTAEFQEVMTLMKERKIDAPPITFALYFQALSV